MVRSPNQIMKSLSPLICLLSRKLTIYIQKIYIVTMIHFGNMHNGSIILNVRMYASQMLNILLNDTPTVSSSIITKMTVYTGNLLNLNAFAMTNYQLTH